MINIYTYTFLYRYVYYIYQAPQKTRNFGSNTNITRLPGQKLYLTKISGQKLRFRVQGQKVRPNP